ncbi:MAG: peptidylprolyl isomerase [Actinomycetota bacterium]
MSFHLRRLGATALLAVTLGACTPGFGNYFAPTAAVVNGKKIPEARIAMQMAQAIRDPEFAGLLKGPDAETNRLRFQREILTRLIQEEILLQEAVKLGLRVTPEEVAERVGQARGGLTDEQFQSELDRLSLTIPQVEEFLSRELLLQKVQAEIGKRAEISQRDVRKAYDENKASFDEQIRVAHVLVCGNANPQTRACETTPGDEALARQVSERAQAGEDFAALAREHSDDATTNAEGGELGWIRRGQFIKVFEDAVFGLAPGQISEPLATDFGWHVVKVIAKGRPFEEAREEIEGELLENQQEAAFTEWLRDALEEAAPRIRINPKLGRFDRSNLQIVPLEEPAEA